MLWTLKIEEAITSQLYNTTNTKRL